MSIRFIKSENNPAIARKYNTFYGVHVANPDTLEFGDKYFRRRQCFCVCITFVTTFNISARGTPFQFD